MSIFERVSELSSQGETLALVTVTETTGSAPREPGASMIVLENGTTEGTIGGGTVEHLAQEAALEAIESDLPSTATFELRPGGNTGMVCEGTMDVFINVIGPSKRLLMVGGGHIAVPVVRFANELGYDVTVIEDREDYATDDRFPAATIFNEGIEEAMERYSITPNTAVVIATRSSTFDRRAARNSLSTESFYVGCVSSEAKANHIKEGLHSDGVERAAIERLRAPIGVDVGAETPAEIALSIMTEVEAVRTGSSTDPHSQISTDTGGT